MVIYCQIHWTWVVKDSLFSYSFVSHLRIFPKFSIILKDNVRRELTCLYDGGLHKRRSARLARTLRRGFDKTRTAICRSNSCYNCPNMFEVPVEWSLEGLYVETMSSFVSVACLLFFSSRWFVIKWKFQSFSWLQLLRHRANVQWYRWQRVWSGHLLWCSLLSAAEAHGSGQVSGSLPWISVLSSLDVSYQWVMTSCYACHLIGSESRVTWSLLLFYWLISTNTSWSEANLIKLNVWHCSSVSIESVRP